MHLTRDGNQGSGVHFGVLKWSYQIRSPWPGGGHGHSDPPGCHRVSLGHVAGPLLMTGQHMTYRTVEQRVIGGQNRTAGDTEDDLHPLVLEGLEERLRSCEW